MRPYLAIIKDSFRAALASRVLYVLLLLITILLLALLPFRVKEVLDWKLQFGQHVTNPEVLVQRLVENRDNSDRPDLVRIWNEIPASLQADLVAIANGTDPDADPETRAPGGGYRVGKYQDLVKQLNEMIKDPGFYRPEDWDSRPLRTEAEELIQAGPASLSEERSRRLNRLLIATALSPDIQSGSPTSLDFYYATWKWEILSSNQTHAQFAAYIASFIPVVFDKFVMSIGLLIAILVTANIIPETFDPGSLNLLLSKPVSRPALFLAKFVGGCAFVALCAVYLFLGTWLWLGLGLGVWDRAFLYSIPLYILVFAIYYSVSALIGLTYRSAILAVIVTGLFWGFCWGVGFGFGLLNNRVENIQLVDVRPVADQLISIDGMGRAVAWKPDSDEWEKVAVAEMRDDEEMAMGIAMWVGKLRDEPARLPAIYDRQSNAIIMGVASMIDPFARTHQELFVGSATHMDFQAAGKFPRDAMAVFPARNGPLVVNSSGKFFQLKSDQLSRILNQASDESASPPGEQPAKDAAPAQDESTDPANQPQKTEPTEPAEERFQPIGPRNPVAVRRTTSVDFNRATEEIAIYDRGRLVVFKPTESGNYRQDRAVAIDTETTATMSCFVKFAGNLIFLVLGNGQVISVDAATLEEQNGYLPETRFGIEQLVSSPDGRWFALLYRNKQLWLFDADHPQTIRKPSIGSQGDISAIEFDSDNQLWIVDRIDRATRYDPETMNPQSTYAPPSELIERAYRYVIRPFYRVCPKPSEFYKVVTHLSDTSDSSSNRDVDLTRGEKASDPYSPLWSGLGFMVFVLGLSCTIFSFKDY